MYRVRLYLELTLISKEVASSKIMAPQGSAGEVIKTNPAEIIGQMTRAILILSLSQLAERTHGYTQFTTEALAGRSDWPFAGSKSITTFRGFDDASRLPGATLSAPSERHSRTLKISQESE